MTKPKRYRYRRRLPLDGFKGAVTIPHPICTKCGGPSHREPDGADAPVCGYCEEFPAEYDRHR